MKIKILLLAFFSLIGISMLAHDLSDSQIESLKKRVLQKVEEFQNYHSVIVNTDISENHRKNAISSALALFMGRGQEYTTTDENGNVEYHRPVRMQISSVNRSSTKSMKMTEYLDRQFKNALNYAKVVVESADIVRVGKIYKVNDGEYRGTAYFCSKYISYNKEGRVVYGDITDKKVNVSIYVKQLPGGEEIFEVRLGDVYVIATKRIRS